MEKIYQRGLSYISVNGEEWRDIPGYEGLYQVSNFGRVKSLSRKGSPRDFLLRGGMKPDGYLQCAIVKNRKASSFLVHRLVAIAFLGKRVVDPSLDVNHIDGNKLNNTVENLELCTRSENIKHSFRIGLKDQHGDNHHARKLNSSQVKEIRHKFAPRKYTRRMLANEYNISVASIKKILNNTNWANV